MSFVHDRRRRAIALSLALAATAVSASAASAALDIGARTAAPAVRAKLSLTVEGWTSYNARLTRVSGGVLGGDALIVAGGSRTDGFSIFRSSVPVPAATVGEPYLAAAWIRSDRPGKRVCLRVRERNQSAALIGSAEACITASSAWQQVPSVRYVAKGTGAVDYYVYQSPSAAGDSFVVDGLALTFSSPKPQPAPRTRFFADSSPVNQKIPSGAEVDPASPAMVQQLVTETAARGWGIATNDWTASIWYADAQTPRHEIPLGVNPLGGTKIVDVPIPANAVPGGESDGEMVVVDRSTGCVYDFGRAKKTSGGAWQANFVNALSEDGSGIFPWANSNSGSGFSYLAGKILPEELKAGRIDHALTFAMHHTKKGGPVLPATGSDGWSTLAGAIPEGAQIQLDPKLNLDSLGLAPWQKTIARALQEYGMYLFDTGGAVALYAQATTSTSTPYPWGNVPYAYLPSTLAQHLRVLKTGPQYDPIPGWEFMRHPCAQYR